MNIKKVVFYGAGIRSFRTIGISQLFEIAQKYPVILLAEELDEKIKNILNDKSLFPKLEKILFVYQHSGPKMNIFKKNWQLRNLAKKVISDYKPDVIVAPRDNYPFEMYLMRFAKKINALKVVFQVSHIVDIDDVKKEVDLTNVYLRIPNFLPLSLRLFLIKCRKHIGHFLYYWILPILAGERPFFGKSSYILRQGTSGMRDSDYQIVFSQREHELCRRAGVPEEKLYLLSHPLERESREFLIKNLLEKQKQTRAERVVTILVPPNDLGFLRADFSLISKEERMESRKEIIGQIAAVLKGWKIFIKPHPDIKNFNEIKDAFELISNSIEVVNPGEPMDKYVDYSNVVIGLAKANTNVLFYTSLLSPEKIVLALDLAKELLGDFYKNFEGIEYIDDKRKFIDILNSIAKNLYQKKARNKKVLGPKEFSSAVEAVEKLFLMNSKPNIIWFIIDSFRPYLLSPLEEDKEPTFIDELAQRGVSFEQCITAAPYTIASTHAMFTSFYPSVNKLDGWFKNTPDDLDKNVVTFTDILKAKGYFTSAFFPKRSKAYLPPYSFDHFQLVGSPNEFSVEKYISASSPKLAIFYLEEIHDTCCQNAGKFDKQKYFQSVKESAQRVKYFYEKCAKEDDIIVITSDHGIRLINEPSSELHINEFVAGKFLTDKTIKTFFVLSAKDKITPGVKIKEQVRTIDIVPTVLDIAGLPVLKGQGLSLLPFLKGKKTWPEPPAFIITGGSETSPWRPDMWAIRTPKWKFVLNKTKKSLFKTVYKQELYDIGQDPAEIINVVDKYPDVAHPLFKNLKEMLLENKKTVKDYYKENNFDYKKYLKTRIYPWKLRLELWFRTFVAFKLYLRPRVQLGVMRIKIRKFLKKKLWRIQQS